jgi:2-iminobutanoate/2-iminopropanoate deaminase
MNPTVSYPLDQDTPVSHLPFSPCVRVGNLVFVSGQASVDKTGKIISDTFEAEFRRSLENLRAVLRTAGCDLSDVIQTRYNELYREYFKAPLPARTTITNCLPPTLHYEIECVAVVKG